MNRRTVGRDQPDLWDPLIAGAVEHEQAIAAAVAKEAKIERRRNGRSNWTGDRQTLAEIRSLVQLRHQGPCDTDDGEAYLRAALPWIAAKAGTPEQAYNVDIRGDNDTSFEHGVKYLVKERMPPMGAAR